jgi:hypothetical protein
MSWKLRSTPAAFVLAALFTASAAEAQPLSFQGSRGESLLGTAWGWLSSLLTEEGGMMDPNGSKAGGMMDPNGIVVDAGGMMDPNGCSADAGGMMDPNGNR